MEGVVVHWWCDIPHPRSVHWCRPYSYIFYHMRGEDIIISYGTFFPLNLDPLGSEPASPSGSEQGPYLHLSSLITFLPHHHHYPSFSKC